jgi:regulator of protease activity HflC (stomatin/prohibitin superfamily)
MKGNYMERLLPFLFLFLALLIIAAKSLAVVREDERLVILRLGKLVGVRGPGLNIILPFLDRAIRVKVERIAGWKRLPESELQKKAVDIALSGDR